MTSPRARASKPRTRSRSALVGLAAGHPLGDLRPPAAPVRDPSGELGAPHGEVAERAERQRPDLDLGAVALDRSDHTLRDLLRGNRPDPGRWLGAAVVEHAR